MIPSQRDLAIVSALRQRGVVTVAEICAMCGCSPVTARRDLERLERQGLLLRTHGGAERWSEQVSGEIAYQLTPSASSNSTMSGAMTIAGR